jgi:15-cis-phytoene desaturase
MPTKRVIVAGAGLAGLACAHELLKSGVEVTVLESRNVLGGRTSSWIEDGMHVESGLHKFLGIYRALPALLKEVGADFENVVAWVDELNYLFHGGKKYQFATAPYQHPLSTAASLIGNNDLIPPSDKARLAAFSAAGLTKCLADPSGLDSESIADFARTFGISAETIRDLISTATQAILFLPAEQFSAYAAFSPVMEAAKSLFAMRIGAFKGGMTEVMIQPIAQSILNRGGEIRTGSAVARLLFDQGKVDGVALASGEQLRADNVVLALPLKATQAFLRDPFSTHDWFRPMLRLPSLSAATIQFELDQPALPTDGTNFSPTNLCCFAEQSRTTFPEAPGRFSAILYPPESFIDVEPELVLEQALSCADELGLPLRGHVTDWRTVNHAHDFYAMSPGTEAQRPEQKTPISGLTLAGDYTKQAFSASMEGAVVSGQKAAEAVCA